MSNYLKTICMIIHSMTMVIFTLEKKKNKHVLGVWKCGTLIDFRLSMWLGCLQCGHGQHGRHFEGICCFHLQVLSILGAQVSVCIYYRFIVCFERAIGRMQEASVPSWPIGIVYRGSSERKLTALLRAMEWTKNPWQPASCEFCDL
jgi:hypothetical protein